MCAVMIDVILAAWRAWLIGGPFLNPTLGNYRVYISYYMYTQYGYLQPRPRRTAQQIDLVLLGH